MSDKLLVVKIRVKDCDYSFETDNARMRAPKSRFTESDVGKTAYIRGTRGVWRLEAIPPVWEYLGVPAHLALRPALTGRAARASEVRSQECTSCGEPADEYFRKHWWCAECLNRDCRGEGPQLRYRYESPIFDFERVF